MDPSIVQGALLAGAAISGGLGAGLASASAGPAFRRRRVRRGLVGVQQVASSTIAVEGWPVRVLAYLETLSKRLASGASERVLPLMVGRRKWFNENVGKTGLSKAVFLEAFLEASTRFALGGLALGLAFGAVFSVELMVTGAVLGAYLGADLPRVALRLQMEARVACLKRELPELLEVTALGLRSGLSFDRSFALYAQYFDTAFSRECANAQASWGMGLSSREEALRSFAASFDCAQFSHVVEAMVRSLRFGSSLEKELEQSAAEARDAQRSQREEAAAKAPVKMMIPTGVLILPAMLLMVLGPVLLEMMNGF